MQLSDPIKLERHNQQRLKRKVDKSRVTMSELNSSNTETEYLVSKIKRSPSNSPKLQSRESRQNKDALMNNQKNGVQNRITYRFATKIQSRKNSGEAHQPDQENSFRHSETLIMSGTFRPDLQL